MSGCRMIPVFQWSVFGSPLYSDPHHTSVWLFKCPFIKLTNINYKFVSVSEKDASKSFATMKSSQVGIADKSAENELFSAFDSLQDEIISTIDASKVSAIRRKRDFNRQFSAPTFNEILNKSANSSSSLDDSKNEKTASPASSACIPCTAPGCNSFVHFTNMGRHWKKRHPGTKKYCH